MTTFVNYLLHSIEVICSILLIGVILIQRSKGQGGAGAAFGGGGMGEAVFGSQMGNVLTKSTVILAIIFLVNTTIIAMLGSSNRGRSSVMDALPSGTAPAALPAPLAPPPSAPAPTPAPVAAPDSGFAPADFGTPVAPVDVPSAPAAPVAPAPDVPDVPVPEIPDPVEPPSAE